MHKRACYLAYTEMSFFNASDAMLGPLSCGWLASNWATRQCSQKERSYTCARLRERCLRARRPALVHVPGIESEAQPLADDFKPCDMVVANILAGPLVSLAPEIARLCRPKGAIALSGILAPQVGAHRM